MNKFALYLPLVLGSVVPGFISASNSTGGYERFKAANADRWPGIFPVYRVDDRIYLEIADSLLNRRLTLTAQIDRAHGTAGCPLPTLGAFRFGREEKTQIYLLRSRCYERTAEETDPLKPILDASNSGPVDEVFTVETANPRTGAAVIDITDALSGHDGWFDTSSAGIRLPDTAPEAMTVFPTDDGVLFSFRQNVPGFFRSSAPGVKGSYGQTETSISCMLRLLPADRMQGRRACGDTGFETVGYTLYESTSYEAARDSVLVRWRLEPRPGKGDTAQPAEPIVFHIDPSCPRQWVPSIVSAVTEWNRAFERAGFREALQVVCLDEPGTARCRALIAWDESESPFTCDKTTDPLTGEILSCRIRIGRNPLEGLRERYLLQYGLDDRRILNDFEDRQVAEELFQGVLAREIGRALGLKLPDSDRFIVDEALIAAILRGYGPDRKHASHPSVQPMPVRKRLAELDRAMKSLGEAYAAAEAHMLKMSVSDTENRLNRLQQVRKQLYEAYLDEAADLAFKAGNISEIHETVNFLARHLFAGGGSILPAAVSDEEVRQVCGQRVLKRISDPQKSRRLAGSLLPAAKKGGGYDNLLEALYASLREMLFGRFGDRPVPGFTMNMQSCWVDLLLEEAVDRNAASCDDEFCAALYSELCMLHTALDLAAKRHPDSLTRRLYANLRLKISNRIPV